MEDEWIDGVDEDLSKHGDKGWWVVATNRESFWKVLREDEARTGL